MDELRCAIRSALRVQGGPIVWQCRKRRCWVRRPDAPVSSQPDVASDANATPRTEAHLAVRMMPRFSQRVAVCLAGAVAATSFWPAAAHAQNIQSYFPAGTGGYDRELGVTVLTRLRPLYEVPPLNVGSFQVTSGLDQSVFYNSNFNGTPDSGTWGSRTAASISTSSDWTRNSLTAALGFTHNQPFSFPNESFTDWNVNLGGGYTIGDGGIQAGYSHQTYNQIGFNIGTVTSETPVRDQTDTGYIGYSANFARFTINPSISASAYRFGAATAGGATLDENFLNRNVIAGGVVTRYSLSDEGSLLLVTRGIGSNFVNPLAGQPRQDSTGIQVLGGLDYQAKGVWRYRLLAGVETRMFAASQYPTHTGLITEGSVIWSPTELTTLTGSISRGIEDPETPDTNGFTLTQGKLVVDHELRRNVFLQLRGAVAEAQFLTGGGSQTDISLGGGATWLLNRRIHLSLNYDWTRITGGVQSTIPLAASQTGSTFSQTVVTLGLHLSL